jgi:hypothetical protein
MTKCKENIKKKRISTKNLVLACDARMPKLTGYSIYIQVTRSGKLALENLKLTVPQTVNSGV